MFENLAITEESELKLSAADGSPIGIKDKDGTFHRAVIMVRSRSSDAVRHHDLQVRRRLADEARKNNGKGANTYDPDRATQDGIARMCVIISGWKNLPDGKGGTIEYSEDNKMALASNYKLDYIHRQIFRHHDADENFMPAQPEA